MLNRRAVTLIEVLTALFIIGVLAAALYPTVASQLRRGRSAALGGQIANLRDAIDAYRENVTRYPSTVGQLLSPLGLTATDACGTALTPAIRSKWRGPYLTRATAGELPVGDATVKDTLIRIPATDAATAPGILQIRVINVDTAAALDVERQFDGVGTENFSTGSVLWSSAGFDTLKFQILIRNC